MMTSSNLSDIPLKTQVLIIGGGPGGSYTAAALAREGLDVVLLEADRMPRYHVGESMLASMKHFLRFIDCEAQFDNAGFPIKNGAAFRLSPNRREGYTDFISKDPNNFSWNVVRSRADEILFQHAKECGAKAFDQVKVADVQFSPVKKNEPQPSLTSRILGNWIGGNQAETVEGTDGSLGRPTSATWRTAEGQTGTITFDYLVDASGRVGLLSTKYLHTRHVNQSLKNIALWAYWEGTGVYRGHSKDESITLPTSMPEGVSGREGSPYFEALSDESGWAWFIPLSHGITSVGIVMDETLANQKKKELALNPNSTSAADAGEKPSTTQQLYLSQLKLAENVLNLVGDKAKMKFASPASSSSEESDTDAALRTMFGIGAGGSTIKSASNYSYSASSYAGEGYRIVGDAGAFIDPYFSSGVHLAFGSGLSAAATICASIRGQCSEQEAANWHSASVGTNYTRFLMIVHSAYRQIRAQSFPVLADVDEDNFDRAFEHFRPVIQGIADPITRSKLSEDELQRMIEFCARGFEATDPDERAHVLNHATMRKDGLIVTDDLAADANPGVETSKDGSTDENWLRVARALNARKFLRTEDIQHIDNLIGDTLNGMKIHLKIGELGLISA